MRRNFIDHPRLDSAIALQLSLTSPPLGPYIETLTRLLLRHLPDMRLGERALPELEDPRWAHEKAEQGARLFRLGTEGELEARRMICEFLIDFEALVQISADPTHSYSDYARRHMRGALHWKPGQDDSYPSPRISQHLGLDRFLSRAHKAKQRAQGGRPFARPAIVKAGKLTGTRAVSYAEIVSLGREAQNCLSDDWTVKKKIRLGRDIWALRAVNRVVAVIEVDETGTICELRGVANADSIAGHGADLVSWCQKAGLKVRDDVTVPLTDFLPKALRVPTNDQDRIAWDLLFGAEAA